MSHSGPLVLFGIALSGLPVRAQQPSASALDAMIKRNTELHARAQQAVQTEDERGRKELCPGAKSTMDINACYTGELMTAEANEVKLVRAIGGMLRAGTESPGTPPMRLNFDKAEAAWHTYRDQACNAAGAQYEGGTPRRCLRLPDRHHSSPHRRALGRLLRLGYALSVLRRSKEGHDICYGSSRSEVNGLLFGFCDSKNNNECNLLLA